MEYVNVYNEKYIQACYNKHVKFKIKVELLDWYEFTLGEITRDVSRNDSGKIHITNAQGSRRSCDIALSNIDFQYNPNENSHFWIDRKFKLYYGIQTKDDTFWFSKGVYVTTNASLDMSGKVLSIQGADKFTILTSNENAQRFGGSVKIEQGQPFDEAISALLCLNIGNNRPIDPIRPVIDESIKTMSLPYDIIKNADTSIGDMLVEFASVMDADIWYDDDGRLYVSKSVVEDSVNRYKQFAPQWHFTEKDTHMTEPKLESNQSKMVNTVVVTNASSDKGLDSYFTENDFPQSPLRVSLIGTKASEIVSTEMGYNEQRRKEYANRLLQTQCLNAYALSFSSIALIHLDVNRTVTLTYREYGFDKDTFVVQDIDLDLKTGVMDISATQVVWLPAYSDSGAANFDTHEITPDTYEISFDIGKQASGKTPATKYKTTGDIISLPSANNFSREGYTLDGWVSNVDSITYPVGYSFIVKSQNVKFVAKWKSIERPDIFWTLKYSLSSDKNTITFHPLTTDPVRGVINWGDEDDLADQPYISNETYTHTYSVNDDLPKTVTVKIYVEIEDTQYLTDGIFSFNGTDDKHTVSQLEYIKFPDNIKNIPSNCLSNLVYSSYPNVLEKLTKVILPDSLERISSNAISGCIGVTEITIPDSVTYIDYQVFANSSIEEIVIPAHMTLCGIMNMPQLEKATLLSAGANGQLAPPTLLGSPKLKEVILGDSITHITNGWLSNIGSGDDISITATGLKGILMGGLSNARLKSIVLPNCMQYIGAGTLTGASITNLAIPYGCYVDKNAISPNCSLSLLQEPTSKYSISGTNTTITAETGLQYNGQPQELNIVMSNPDGSVGKIICTDTAWSNNGREFLQNVGQSVSTYQCCELIEGFDYIVEYPTAVNSGNYNVTIKGINRMNGTISVPVNILPYQLSKSIVDNGITKYVANDNIQINGIDFDPVDSTYYINGNSNYYKPSGYKPELQITATFDGFTDNLNEDCFRVEPRGLINSHLTDVGKYDCMIKATSNYSGTIDYYSDGVNRYSYYYFNIKPKNISDSDIDVKFKEWYEYSGTEISPRLSLIYYYDNGMIYELVEGQDYSVTVEDNLTSGGSITVNGIGNFEGELTLEFKINAPTTDTTTGTEEELKDVYTTNLSLGEEEIPAMSYNPTYQSFDIFPQSDAILNLGSENSARLNIKPKVIGLPNLEKTGSGTFNLTVDDNGDLLKRSSAKKYKMNVSYDVDKDYWHDVFMKLKTGSYNYKNTPDIFELGMFADDIVNICPEIARYSKDGVENYDDRAIIQMLVMEVQRLNKEIQAIKDNLK